MNPNASKIPALFPPGWLERTSSDPKLAREEIHNLALKVKRVEDDNSKVRAQRDELERNAARFDRRLTAIALWPVTRSTPKSEAASVRTSKHKTSLKLWKGFEHGLNRTCEKQS